MVARPELIVPTGQRHGRTPRARAVRDAIHRGDIVGALLLVRRALGCNRKDGGIIRPVRRNQPFQLRLDSHSADHNLHSGNNNNESYLQHVIGARSDASYRHPRARASGRI